MHKSENEIQIKMLQVELSQTKIKLQQNNLITSQTNCNIQRHKRQKHLQSGWAR